MDLLSFDLDEARDTSFNKSNINNRHLNVSMILDDIGLKQYKTLFELQEVNERLFYSIDEPSES